MALRATRAVLSALPKPAAIAIPATQLKPTTKINPKKTTILEVERKFRRLTVPTLTDLHSRAHPSNPTTNKNTPLFQSVLPLPTRKIHDIYYDTPDHTLCSAGAWIRKRNGMWEAKVKKGGDFVNSRFEEIVGEREVGDCISRTLHACHHVKSGDGQRRQAASVVSGCFEKGKGVDNDFGLEIFAEFVTMREAWLVDGEFKVVRDKMDFGHEVGEVELEVEMPVSGFGEGVTEEKQKGEVIEEMDRRIEAFMRRYAWAWERGDAVGKLTAYFEMVKGRGGKGV